MPRPGLRTNPGLGPKTKPGLRTKPGPGLGPKAEPSLWLGRGLKAEPFLWLGRGPTAGPWRGSTTVRPNSELARNYRLCWLGPPQQQRLEPVLHRPPARQGPVPRWPVCERWAHRRQDRVSARALV